MLSRGGSFAVRTLFAASPRTQRAHASTSITLLPKTEFPAVTSSGKLMAMLHLDAPVKGIAEQRTPMNISAVLDVSGSMQGEKLRLVKETMCFVVQQLTHEDSLGIVSFSSSVDSVMSRRLMTTHGKASAEAELERLASTGATNLSEGLFAGLDQFSHDSSCSSLQKHSRASAEAVKSGLKMLAFDETSSPSETAAPSTSNTRADAVNAVWVFTDGEANRGICDPRELASATKRKLASLSSDISVFTFGFGTSHNAGLLKPLAEACDGSYYYIENTGMMKEAFADCLGGLMSVVAQDIRVKVECADGVTIDRLMTPYTHSITGTTAEVTMKNLYSEEKRDILLSLQCHNIPLGVLSRMATWTVSYVNAITKSEERVSVVCAADVVEALPDGMKPDADVDEQRNRFIATAAMEKASELAERGRMVAARSCLEEAHACVAASETACTGYVERLLKDVGAAQKCAESVSVFHSEGSKIIARMSWGHARQRSNDVGRGAYENAQQKAMKGKSRDSTL